MGREKILEYLLSGDLGEVLGHQACSSFQRSGMRGEHQREGKLGVMSAEWDSIESVHTDTHIYI
jgi:hypothetical protein